VNRKWLLAIPVVALVAVVGGPFVYINYIQDDPPERLTLEDREPTTATTTGGTVDTVRESIEGEWSLDPTSVVGYRVEEVLFGQDTEAVGRTSDVTGSMSITGTAVEAAEFTVDMTTVTSDRDNRDNQFRGRIMDVETFPTATFTLGEPIDLGAVPADGEEQTFLADGELTLRGVTRPVTFDLVARRSGAGIEVNGAIPLTFGDYGIPDASFGPAEVGDTGELEFLLVFV
jgi:polyisoprenoid-binding protein YceI